MTHEQIDAVIGNWSVRQEKTKVMADELKGLLKSHGFSEVLVQYRAKTNDGIIHKLSRFNEPLKEVLDLFGLRVVVVDVAELRQVAKCVISNFGAEPLAQEMTIRNGTMIFPAIRDYQKRDWVGVSPATLGGYNEAIHINRKVRGCIVELQIMTNELFEKYCAPDSDASHSIFKQRQNDLFKK